MKIVKRWTDEEIELLKSEYSVNPNIYSRFPDRSYQSITFKAWELGLKAKGRGCKLFDVNYFDQLDENSAYVLGFIAADGNVHRNVLTITQSDRKVLEVIASDMGFDEPYPISPTTTGGFNLQMRNQHLVDRLAGYGICERKSLILGKIKVPDNILRDFTRGVIDGDGSVCVYPDNRRNSYMFDISIMGSYNFLHWLQAAISRITGMPHRKVTDTKSNAKRIHYSGMNAVLLHVWCYGNNPSLYFERKRKKLDEYISIYPDRITYSYNTPCPGSKYILLQQSNASGVALLGDDIVQG